MKDEFITRVGVWGQRHYSYLKKHFPTVINVMRMKGTLEQYLKDIDKDAKDMFDKLTKQLADSEGIRYLIANCKLVHTPDIDYEDYYNRLKSISDKINNHLIFLNQTGTLDEPEFHKFCEEAVETAKQLSDELTEKLDIEIEKSRR